MSLTGMGASLLGYGWREVVCFVTIIDRKSAVAIKMYK